MDPAILAEILVSATCEQVGVIVFRCLAYGEPKELQWIILNPCLADSLSLHPEFTSPDSQQSCLRRTFTHTLQSILIISKSVVLEK